MDQDTLLLNMLAGGFAQCKAVIDEDGGLLFSLFMAGLVGSASHCVGMCGPFVLSQTVARLEGVPASRMTEFHRLVGAALVPYHLGRLTTYVALGAVAALVASGLSMGGELRWLSAALLALAALFFLGYALRKVKAWLPGREESGGEGLWSRTVGRFAGPLFAKPVGLRGYGLGIALGFLPCGLVYGALAAAASLGSPLAGGMGMAAFAVGTVPSLLTIGLAGHVAGARWQGAVARVAPVLLGVNAAVLSWMAWKLVA